jgi:hypothetical protein
MAADVGVEPTGTAGDERAMNREEGYRIRTWRAAEE